MIWLEMLARIVVLHMIGAGHDGYDDNEGMDVALYFFALLKI